MTYFDISLVATFVTLAGICFIHENWGKFILKLLLSFFLIATCLSIASVVNFLPWPLGGKEVSQICILILTLVLFIYVYQKGYLKKVAWEKISGKKPWISSHHLIYVGFILFFIGLAVSIPQQPFIRLGIILVIIGLLKSFILKSKSRQSAWVAFMLGIFLFSVVQHGFIEIYRAIDIAMEPTIYEGDYLFLLKFLNKPQPGDIVVYDSHTSRIKYKVHRLMGEPGDIVRAEGEKLFLKDIELTSINVQRFLPPKRWKNEHEAEIPQGMYAVVGDNEKLWHPGRVWFLVPEKDIKGKVIWIFHPPIKIKSNNINKTQN